MNHNLKQILDAIQSLDEIGGANDLNEYVKILEEVKAAVDKRLESAQFDQRQERLNNYKKAKRSANETK